MAEATNGNYMPNDVEMKEEHTEVRPISRGCAYITKQSQHASNSILSAPSFEPEQQQQHVQIPNLPESQSIQGASNASDLPALNGQPSALHIPAPESQPQPAGIAQATAPLTPIPPTPAAPVMSHALPPMSAPTPPPAATAPLTRPSSIPPASFAPPEKPNPHGSPTRVYLNQNVTPHLLEGMKYLAANEPEKPLKWLSEFLAKRSAEMEGGA